MIRIFCLQALSGKIKYAYIHTPLQGVCIYAKVYKKVLGPTKKEMNFEKIFQ